MIDLPIVKKTKLKVSLRTSIHEEFRRFVAWAKTHEPQANESHVLEFILSEALNGHTSEMRAFAKWKEERNVEADQLTSETSKADAGAETSNDVEPSDDEMSVARKKARAILQDRGTRED